jgi:hypothetical protein
MHIGGYVSYWKTIATQADDVAESRAHTRTSVAGCLSGDAPLWLSERRPGCHSGRGWRHQGRAVLHFDNKEALGYSIVDEVIASNLHQKRVQPLRNAKNHIDGLVRIVQSESLKREDVQRGCPLPNLSQEMSGLDEGFHRRTAKSLRTSTTRSRRHWVKDRNAEWIRVI